MSDVARDCIYSNNSNHLEIKITLILENYSRIYYILFYNKLVKTNPGMVQAH